MVNTMVPFVRTNVRHLMMPLAIAIAIIIVWSGKLPLWFSLPWSALLVALVWVAFYSSIGVNTRTTQRLQEDSLLGEAEENLAAITNIRPGRFPDKTLPQIEAILLKSFKYIRLMSQDDVSAIIEANRFRLICERFAAITLGYVDALANLTTTTGDVKFVLQYEDEVLPAVNRKLDEMLEDYANGKLTDLEVKSNALLAILEQ